MIYTEPWASVKHYWGVQRPNYDLYGALGECKTLLGSATTEL